MLSLLVHLIVMYSMRLFGTYNFTMPVTSRQLIAVDLTEPVSVASKPIAPETQDKRHARNNAEDKSIEENPGPPKKLERKASPLTTGPLQQKTSNSPDSASEKINPPSQHHDLHKVNSPDTLRQPVKVNLPYSPLNTVSEFLSTKNEKLTYLISMFGLPVGSAELEAKHEEEEVLFTLRVRSSTAISSVFPVDDIVETRHISGKFIMSKIIQHEGTFSSDQGFTVNLAKKRVSWFDNIGGRSQTVPVPSDEVIDTLSGIYLLRSRTLQVGKTEILHIFDSETYADVPVEILSRETIRLPNLQKVDTVVIRPIQQTAGIFRRTGDVRIWITDDANKVPVKIVTSVSLGTVTVELLSAESTSPGEVVTAK
ncbi:MAG: DUF3108 domain-containing protein [Desulfuromonadaceae bacterium]|nr:DUF3108 domain-containing protein [Desulfuromonadaceae bacterium]